MDDNDRKPTTKIPAVKAEIHARQSDELHRGQTRVLGTRVAHVESRVEHVEGVLAVPPRPAARPEPPPLPRRPSDPELRDATIEATRQTSEAKLDFLATVGAMIEHNKRLEAVLTRYVDAERAHGETNEAQDHALVLIARELGIEDKLPPQLLKSIAPPPASSAPPAPPILGRLERRAKRSQLFQGLLAVAVIVKALIDFLGPLVPPHH